jgi:uncharacterized protein with PIN domain
MSQPRVNYARCQWCSARLSFIGIFECTIPKTGEREDMKILQCEKCLRGVIVRPEDVAVDSRRG